MNHVAVRNLEVRDEHIAELRALLREAIGWWEGDGTRTWDEWLTEARKVLHMPSGHNG